MRSRTAEPVPRKEVLKPVRPNLREEGIFCVFEKFQIWCGGPGHKSHTRHWRRTMELDMQALLQRVQGTLPAEYKLGEVSVTKQAPRKYRVGLTAKHSGSQPLLRWRSLTITGRHAGCRDTAPELSALETITAQTWTDLAAKASQRDAIQHQPPATAASLVNKRQKRLASPAAGSLREPGAGGAERLRGSGAGGKREGCGRPKGTLGKAARRAKALELREQVVKAHPGAFSLSARRLEEVLRAWHAHEPELALEALKQFCRKGTASSNKSQAAKKIKRAREAESKARGLDSAAQEFRAESIAYFDRVLEDARKAIESAAEMEDVSILYSAYVRWGKDHD